MKRVYLDTFPQSYLELFKKQGALENHKGFFTQYCAVDNYKEVNERRVSLPFTGLDFDNKRTITFIKSPMDTGKTTEVRKRVIFVQYLSLTFFVVHEQQL